MLNILIYQSILHTALNAHDPGHWCLQQDAVQQALITSLKLQPQSSSQQMTLQEGSWGKEDKANMLRLVLEQKRLCLLPALCLSAHISQFYTWNSPSLVPVEEQLSASGGASGNPV